MTILDRIKIAIINAAYRIRRNKLETCKICGRVIRSKNTHYQDNSGAIDYHTLCHHCWHMVNRRD